MKISISTGNMKLGTIPSFSLPPGLACRPDAPCYKSGACYALKGWRLYPEVRTAWRRNLKILKSKDGYDKFWTQMREWLGKHRPDRFRIHVAGDFLDGQYLGYWNAIALQFSDIKFLAFTKRYDLMTNGWEGLLAPNFKIVVSRWPGLGCDLDPTIWPMAWMDDPKYHDVYIPRNAKCCSGSCMTCARCWNMRPGQHVVFHRH